MFDGPDVVKALASAGVTHVVWVPDSELGLWEAALASSPSLELVRVCREGEAIAVAAGLLLGGKRPIVLLQCTGLFEAGDSLRNAVHDLKLPLVLVVGVRSFFAHQKGQSADTCPLFAEPIVRGWQLAYRWLGEEDTPATLAETCRRAWAEQRAFALLLPE